MISSLGVPVSYFESEYHIVNTYLQLSDSNKSKADTYVDNLLAIQKEEENKIVQLFPVQVLSEVQTIRWSW